MEDVEDDQASYSLQSLVNFKDQNKGASAKRTSVIQGSSTKDNNTNSLGANYEPRSWMSWDGYTQGQITSLDTHKCNSKQALRNKGLLLPRLSLQQFSSLQDLPSAKTCSQLKHDSDCKSADDKHTENTEFRVSDSASSICTSSQVKAKNKYMKKGNAVKKWPPTKPTPMPKPDFIKSGVFSPGIVRNVLENIYGEASPPSPKSRSFSVNSNSPSLIRIATSNSANEKTSSTSLTNHDSILEAKDQPEAGFVNYNDGASAITPMPYEQNTIESLENYKKIARENMKQDQRKKSIKSLLKNVEPRSPLGLLAIVTQELSGKQNHKMLPNKLKTQGLDFSHPPFCKDHFKNSQMFQSTEKLPFPKQHYSKIKNMLEVGVNPYQLYEASEDSDESSKIMPIGQQNQQNFSYLAKNPKAQEIKMALKNLHSVTKLLSPEDQISEQENSLDKFNLKSNNHFDLKPIEEIARKSDNSISNSEMHDHSVEGQNSLKRLNKRKSSKEEFAIDDSSSVNIDSSENCVNDYRNSNLENYCANSDKYCSENPDERENSVNNKSLKSSTDENCENELENNSDTKKNWAFTTNVVLPKDDSQGSLFYYFPSVF